MMFFPAYNVECYVAATSSIPFLKEIFIIYLIHQLHVICCFDFSFLSGLICLKCRKESRLLKISVDYILSAAQLWIWLGNLPVLF